MSWKTALIVSVVVLVGLTAWGTYAYAQCVGPFAGMRTQSCPMVTSAPADTPCPHYAGCPGPMTNGPCIHRMQGCFGHTGGHHMGWR